MIKANFRKIVFGVFVIFNVFCVAIFISAQSTKQDTDSTPNINLKSSARVNPATLAMEFSLPLGGYPGRAGNSTPLALNYSSKVWTMKHWSFSTNPDPLDAGEGSEPRPWKFITRSSAAVEYGKRTAAGWTTNLQPIKVVEMFEYLEGGPLNSFGDGQWYNCTFQSSEWIFGDPSCPGGMEIANYTCVPEAQFTSPTPVPHSAVRTCIGGGGEGGGGGGGGFPVPGPVLLPPPPGIPPPLGVLQRIHIALPDGSTKEFRKDEKYYDCNDPLEAPFCGSLWGIYTSVDGTGMRLLVNKNAGNNIYIHELYLPDGGKYIFAGNAQEFIDRNGNKSTYDFEEGAWIDTMGQELKPPLPAVQDDGWYTTVGIKTYDLPAMNGQSRTITQKWEALKPAGCSTGFEPECAESPLEDPQEDLLSVGTDACSSETTDNPQSPSLFEAEETHIGHPEQVGNEWQQVTKKYRICAPLGGSNQVVLSEIILPDGSKYKFKYNTYGEITKIIYPTGSYERFRYEQVVSVGANLEYPYSQANRGVVEHWISEDGINETQKWVYGKESITFDDTNVHYSTIINPDDSKLAYKSAYGIGSVYFQDPRSGRNVEEMTFSKRPDPNQPESELNKRIPLSRKLNEWTVAPSRNGPLQGGERDARLAKSVSIIFENGKALATLSETEYDEEGDEDPEFFSHLNVKLQKGYHFKVIDYNTAMTANIETIAALFTSSDLASVSETDYMYDPAYKERGILGLPIESRSLNPTNLNDVLAKTQFVYDETAYFDNNYTTTNWEDPQSNLRRNVTTTRTWVKDTDTWLLTHTMYDNFGNVRKVWDASGDVNKFVETEYSAAYKYAYPTKVITPAPDPTNTHGTNQTSTAETTYDFNTGLPLSVKDDFGQITKTEYDGSLRPIRVYADNFTAPESQTVYGVPDGNGQFQPNQRFVKVRKQIDQNNWDEAITWMDGLGRTIQTQAKDGQGDIFVDTVYDEFGRVERVTNPYRIGDTVYWSKTGYDLAGRAVESFAPAELANLSTAESLGVTSFDISTVTGVVGTVVMTEDASGRKGRSITNALGQLLRVDEPTAIGGTADNDLGTLVSPNQPTSYKYDLYGNMVEVTQGVQKRWFKYDSMGRMVRVRQPEQEVNTGLNLADTFNTSGQWTAGFTYDVLGNVLTATDANGVTITNSYDRAGRVKTRTYSDTTPSVSFYYDGKGLASPQSPNYAKGQLTKVTSSVSETQYQLFDNLGRMMQMAQITDGNTYTSKYTYNFAGALIEEEYPSGRIVKNEFETDGDLMKVSSQKAGGSIFTPYASNFSYTASGGVSQMRLGNGRWETAKFNNRLQVTELGLGNSAINAVLWKTNYDYGELQTGGDVDTAKNTGNIARQTLTTPAGTFVQRYTYDSLYRLTRAAEKSDAADSWTQEFTYDRYGNRIGIDENIASLTNNQTPAIDVNSNRFAGSQGFAYDLNGNIVQDQQGRQFTFNGDNKQTVVKDVNNITIGEYFYDGEGKRVKKITNLETTVFVYSAGKLIAEYSTEVSSTPAVSYTTTDHIGSPRIITDQFGQVKSRRDFLPFGEDVYQGVGARTENLGYPLSQDDIRQKFTGYQKDTETGLDFAEARMYANNYGRFTAVDPLLASGRNADPQTFNRFVYVRNAPLVLVDPTGLFGDYYDRQGNYIGNDGIDDKMVYYADVTRRDTVNNIIYVGNVVPTTLDQVRPGTNSSISQAESTLGTSTSNFTEILQRRNFYAERQSQNSNGTRWAGAASAVSHDVSNLTWGPALFFRYSNPELAEFANTGNRMIFNDAFPKLGELARMGPLSPDAAFNWDSMTMAQEQSLIDPIYHNLSTGSFSLLDNNVKRNFLITSMISPVVANTKPFPQNRDLMNVSHRWEFGMKTMGYNVTADQMPNPGIQYTGGEMHNRFNPGRPVGPIVARFSF